ncbi:hypothetical protein K440DRAFT_630880 [Wilcoxina mikolae CBS 423.85]|nr:hypothetical protein K440DRAFT_630880 [Wilcoxina mikolae CBS 423.85]
MTVECREQLYSTDSSGRDDDLGPGAGSSGIQAAMYITPPYRHSPPCHCKSQIPKELNHVVGRSLERTLTCQFIIKNATVPTLFDEKCGLGKNLALCRATAVDRQSIARLIGQVGSLRILEMWILDSLGVHTLSFDNIDVIPHILYDPSAACSPYLWRPGHCGRCSGRGQSLKCLRNI